MSKLPFVSREGIKILRNNNYIPPQSLSRLITFNGEKITYHALNRALHRNGNVLMRGANLQESPLHSSIPGVVSRGEILSESCVRAHTRKTIGISTTTSPYVASRFAATKFLEGKKGCLHLWDKNLIPDTDKTFVPAVEGVDFTFVTGELETVFHNSVPEECYIGYASILGWMCAAQLCVNRNFIDSTLIKENAKLLEQFYNTIYFPFKAEIGPKLREKALTDRERNVYELGRKEFHTRYVLFSTARETSKRPSQIADTPVSNNQ